MLSKNSTFLAKKGVLCEKHGNVWRRKWRKKMTKGIYGSAGSGDMVVKLPKQFFRFESLLLFPD